MSRKHEIHFSLVACPIDRKDVYFQLETVKLIVKSVAQLYGMDRYGLGYGGIIK